MGMLEKDEAVFRSRFHEARSFILAAELRSECYVLCRENNWNEWRDKRLDELLHAPACRETWFIVMLRGDFREKMPELEEILVKHGL
jgi:hypothetical protein